MLYKKRTANDEGETGKWKIKIMRLNGREDVIMNRLRLGHTLITHG